MLPKTPATQTTGLILTRVVIPLWILMGVVFKLWSGSPMNLPQTFVSFARDNGIDLGLMLYTLIGLEILAIGVIVFLARFAKPMAMFMLTMFCLILLNEMRVGAESCGCFGGGVEIKPWQMLVADGTLLVLVALFPVKVAEDAWGFSKAVPTMVGFGIVGMVISFGGAAILHQELAQEPPEVTEDGELDPTLNPDPKALPAQYWTRNLDDWEGRKWRDIDLFQFMRRWPTDMDHGARYVIFYSRTCHHCEEMFLYDIAPYPEIEEMVVAVEIPAGPGKLTDEENAWPMPEMDVELLALPHQRTDWIIQSPLIVTVEDGIVTCVNEGDHLACMDL